MTNQIYVPPHSVQAEQSVLSGLMFSNKSWDDISELLMPADFYRHDHQQIFKAIKQLADRGKPFDIVTIGEAMEAMGTLDDAGGMAYLTSIVQNSPGASNIKAYAEIVRERAVLRELQLVAGEVAAEARGNEPVDELVARAQQKFANIGRPIGKGPRQLMTAYPSWLSKLDDRINSSRKLSGASVGIPALDGILSGVERGNFYIIAGRPGMAKTTLGSNICEAFANRGEVALMQQLEMIDEQLIGRSISTRARIDSDRIRHGELEQEEWDEVLKAANELQAIPFFVDDQPGLTVTEIKARARRLKRQQGRLDLILIDYLQLLREKAENKTAEITKISQGLKELAKELDVPVIALSQLNRELEKRTNKRPIASDLRDSGSLEQDADAIIFIYREGAYDEEFLYDDVTELIINKQRHGPRGTVYAKYHAAQYRFDVLDESLKRDYLSAIAPSKRGGYRAQKKGFED